MKPSRDAAQRWLRQVEHDRQNAVLRKLPIGLA